MGLLKMAQDSIKGVLESQNLRVIRSQDMGNNVLMAKKTGDRGIIRNGSVIIVNPGQMAVIVDNGKVVDATAEPGSFEFDSASSPSFFAGDFKQVFKEMWARFTFGAGTYQDQAVYFINTKEIIDNGFGTFAPVMYRDWEHCSNDARRPGNLIPLRVGIRCSGNYTFQIDDPAKFLMKIGGTAPMYTKDELCEQMRMEIISVFQAVLNSLCNETNQVYPLELPAQSFFIKQLMDQNTFDKNIRERGLKIVGFNILNVNLDEESKKRVDEFIDAGDFAKQQAKLTDAVLAAAGNESGAGMGFLNLNMMNQAMGGMFQNTIPNPSLVQSGQNNFNSAAAGQPQPMQKNTCPNCGNVSNGKFCSQCGSPMGMPQEKFCSNCGQKTNGKFCANCGAKIE